MKEDPSNFIKFCEKNGSRQPYQRILRMLLILEGRIVLRKLRDVPTGFAVLMGILYSLNIDYPKGLKYTFEVIQKVIMDIGEAPALLGLMDCETNCFSAQYRDVLRDVVPFPVWVPP
ncbi:hypothetical protein F7725_028742 [Dissostichus mawsoni]|uniref:Uncharacterized protein n=1 Tax=Dissostichus mawsoni TaxID=36200 RepID=A0A7J5XGM5_DISMA|nr:hypothetical protein F7725_028742 [Dissostichus mawsoni]